MIVGAHTVIYSRDADADRAFLRDVLELPGIDAGGGWTIFALPPSEVAIHPAEESGRHELYLLCDDVQAFTRSLRERGVECSPVAEQRWGSVVEVSLPGGGKLGVYEPKHPRPAAGPRGTARRKAGRAATPKAAKAPGRRRRKGR